MDNGQSRMISGTEASVAYGEMTRDHLATAKENLRRFFSVVGVQDYLDEVQDYLDEFLLMVKDHFAMRSVAYLKRNVRKRPSVERAISSQDRAKIEAANELDMQLYEFARAGFLQRREEMGESLAAKLRHFQRFRRGKA